jgi:hypothetical protein
MKTIGRRVPSGYKAVATTDQAGFEGQAITIVKEK